MLLHCHSWVILDGHILQADIAKSSNKRYAKLPLECIPEIWHFSQTLDGPLLIWWIPEMWRLECTLEILDGPLVDFAFF